MPLFPIVVISCSTLDNPGRSHRGQHSQADGIHLRVGARNDRHCGLDAISVGCEKGVGCLPRIDHGDPHSITGEAAAMCRRGRGDNCKIVGICEDAV